MIRYTLFTVLCQLDTSLIYLPISDVVGYCVFYRRTSARNEEGSFRVQYHVYIISMYTAG